MNLTCPSDEETLSFSLVLAPPAAGTRTATPRATRQWPRPLNGRRRPGRSGQVRRLVLIASGGDVQQRLQAQRPGGGFVTRGLTDACWSEVWPRSCATSTGGSTSARGAGAPGPAQRALGPPESRADHRPRAAQPEPVRRTGVGRDARQCRPCVALRPRHRPLQQSHLGCRRRADGGLAGRDPPPRGCVASDGAGHHRLLDELHHLPAFRRLGPRRPVVENRPLSVALSDPGRP